MRSRHSLKGLKSYSLSFRKAARSFSDNHSKAKLVVLLVVIQLCREHKVDASIDSLFKVASNLDKAFVRTSVLRYETLCLASCVQSALDLIYEFVCMRIGTSCREGLYPSKRNP